MSVLATDNFNRANGSLGANWTTISGSSALSIVSNQVQYSAVGSDCGAYYNAATPPADQYIKITIVALGSSGTDSGMGGVLRQSTSANTHYRVHANSLSSGSVFVAKDVAGAYSAIGAAFTGVGWVAGDVLEARIQGTTITLLKNGVSIGTRTDSSIAAAGRCGIMYSSSSSGALVDDFEMGDFNAGGAAQQQTLCLLGAGA